MSEQKYAARIYVSDFVDEQAVWEKINSLGIILEITTTLDPMRGGQYIDVLFLKNENEITGTNFLSSKGRIISSHTYEKLPDETTRIKQPVITAEMIRKPLEEALEAAKLPSNRVVRKTYEQYYWAYVTATNSLSAAENFAEMINSVTEDMEPAEGMHSWVKDPEERKSEKIAELADKMSWYAHIAMYVGLGLMMAAIILQLGFGITL